MLILKPSPHGHIGYFHAYVGGTHFRRYLDAIKNIPSRRWDNQNKVWVINISDYWILKKELERLELRNITIDEGLSKIFSQYKAWEQSYIELCNSEDAEIPVDESTLKMKLMPHQRVALAFMLRRKLGINGSEMGTGKTFPAIVCAKYLKEQGLIRDCLVVCIASIKWNWAFEIKKCVSGLSFQVIEGESMERAAQYMSKADVKIVNYELLRNDIEPILHDRVFDCIIVDEIHRIRSHNTKQTKALYKLGKKAKYRYGLTGTPIHNKLDDLYSIMRFIHPKFFGEWFPFDRRYCVRGYFGNVTGYQHLNEVHEKIKTVMFRKLKSEVLQNLPPKVYNDIFIDLTYRQRKFYRDTARRILDSQYEEVDNCVRQSNILANVTYLREICDSTELVDPSLRESAKMDELKRIIPELIENGHKIVIFSQFEKMVQIIARELKFPSILLHGGIPVAGGARDKLIHQFSTSKTHNLFIMTTAGGEGINLQAADYIILFDLPFNPQVIAQVEDRLHRKGQQSTVNVIKLIARETIEERVLEILQFKTDLFREVIDGMTGEPVSVSQKEILNALAKSEEEVHVD